METAPKGERILIWRSKRSHAYDSRPIVVVARKIGRRWVDDMGMGLHGVAGWQAMPEPPAGAVWPPARRRGNAPPEKLP
jgi:hypothetical protein